MSFIQAYESGVIETIVQAYVDGGVATPTLSEVMSTTNGNIASDNLDMNNLIIANCNGVGSSSNLVMQATGGVSITSIAGDIQIGSGATNVIAYNRPFTANYTSFNPAGTLNVGNSGGVVYSSLQTGLISSKNLLGTINMPNAGVFYIQFNIQVQTNGSSGNITLYLENQGQTVQFAIASYPYISNDSVYLTLSTCIPILTANTTVYVRGSDSAGTGALTFSAGFLTRLA
jgi:hypothetical protein